MQNKLFSTVVLLIIITIFTNCNQQNKIQNGNEPDFPGLSGSYLGQKPPGVTPVIFAPNIISSAMEELNVVFFPGGRELIYSISFGSMRWALVGMREVDSVWTKPEVLPFSGLYSDVDACISPDGSRVWFSSNRPLTGIGEPKEDFDIWYVDKTPDGWSEPVNPGAPVNSEANEFFPIIVNSGTIYFQSWREGGHGAADIYNCTFKDGVFMEAIPLPEPVNNSGFQGDTYIAPEESYAIVSTTPVGERGWSDLFISFKDEHGNWGNLINMGPGINSSVSENTPFVSTDGKYLFFKSRKRENYELGNVPITYHDIKKIFNSPGNGNGDIYWVDAKVIQDLKPNY